MKTLHHALAVLGEDVIVRAGDGFGCDPLLGQRQVTRKAG